MFRELKTIPVSLDRHAVPSTLDDMLADAVRLCSETESLTGSDRMSAFRGTDPAMAWHVLSSVREQVPDSGVSFCEWGSGLGIVTCIAGVLGWQASGVELEPSLVASARAFADRHALVARFSVGRYPLDTNDEQPTALFEHDVLYAYTWPAERERVTEVIRKGAPVGALFIRYGGGMDLSVFRVTQRDT